MVEHIKKVLSQYEFDELKEYVHANDKVATDGTKKGLETTEALYEFPTYNFLPAHETATNKIEKLIRKFQGREDQHIEYWFRFADEAAWHVDGDEIMGKKLGAAVINTIDTPQVATTSHVFYVFCQNLEGGELEIATETLWKPGTPVTKIIEPLAGSAKVTIKPIENSAVRFNARMYHRITPCTPKLQGFPFKRTVLVWSIWDEIPEGYKEWKHWDMKGNDTPTRVKWSHI